MTEELPEQPAAADVVAEPEAAPVQEPVAEVAAVPSDDPATDDPALNQQIAEQAIAVPDGEKLIPESLLRNVAISYRNKLKEAKQGSPEAVALRQQLDAAEARLRESEPLAHAFRAIQQAQPPQPSQPVPAEDTTELTEIAKDFDFYRPDGQPDLDRARRVQLRTTRQAEVIARQQNAPLVTHALSAQAQHNIARMKATAHPVTGLKADPRVIDAVVSQLAQQEGGLATLANLESVKHLWSNAYTMSTFDPGFGKAAPTDPAPAPSAPVVTERSGGAAPASATGLSASEKRAAKDAGLTEKQYLEIAAGMKW
jgi:hypothetical protein